VTEKIEKFLKKGMFAEEWVNFLNRLNEKLLLPPNRVSFGSELFSNFAGRAEI